MCHRLGTPASSILTMLLCAGYGDLHCTGEEAEPPTEAVSLTVNSQS